MGGVVGVVGVVRRSEGFDDEGPLRTSSSTLFINLMVYEFMEFTCQWFDRMTEFSSSSYACLYLLPFSSFPLHFLSSFHLFIIFLS